MECETDNCGLSLNHVCNRLPQKIFEQVFSLSESLTEWRMWYLDVSLSKCLAEHFLGLMVKSYGPVCMHVQNVVSDVGCPMCICVIWETSRDHFVKEKQIQCGPGVSRWYLDPWTELFVMQREV